MNNFQYYTPTKVVFGREAEDKAGTLVKEFGGKKVMIHYGGGSAVRSGLIDRIKKSLDAESIPYVELGGVQPNPRVSLVRKGIRLCENEGVDFILAVGGGSVIDSTKAIAYGLYDNKFGAGGDVWDFYDHKRKPEGSFPIGAVLTIAAAGSEMSDSSVITNEDGWKKLGCNSDYCRPKFALMNPELTMTLPDYQTSCGNTDIIMHTFERYFTGKGNMELTDSLATGLVKTVMENAIVLRDDPQNYEARAEVMWASSLSHNGLTGCGNGGNDFATHKMEHELSGLYDVAHGAGLAAMWGSWARYVLDDCLDRFFKFAIEIMDIPCCDEPGKCCCGSLSDVEKKEVALKGIAAMEDFFKAINMPTRIQELGVDPTDEEIEIMADKCSEGNGGKLGSAKLLYRDDFVAIYKAACGR